MMKNKNETVESYVCSLIDILGQKEKLLQLNGIDLKDNLEFSSKIFSETYGIIKEFRNHTQKSALFFNQLKQKHSIKSGFTSNPIVVKSFSDLITSFVSLRDDSHELQFEAVYFLLLSNCEVFLKMLADGVALRGGIDIGFAIKTEENELYGNALLNPYILESKVSNSIRIVIGQELSNYIEHVLQEEVQSNDSLDYNIAYAKLCKELIIKDCDGEYILHYLSDELKEMESFEEISQNAKKFLIDKHNELKIKNQFDIAKKYQQAIKYFERFEIS